MRTVACVLAWACAVAPLGAQSFVRQTLAIAAAPGSGDSRLWRRVADAARSGLRRDVDRRAIALVPADSLERMLRALGIREPGDATEMDQRTVTRLARADELLVGRAVPGPGGIDVQAWVVLVRDPRQREPLRSLRAATPEAAGDSLARALLEVRRQFGEVRQCENAARLGDRAAAIRAATAALRLTPTGLVARICLARALVESGAPADSVLRLAGQVLARDSASVIALALRAQALDGLVRRRDAAEAWAQVLAARPDSADLAVVALERLLALERPAVALDAIDALVGRHASDARFPRLRFRALHTLGRWETTATLGDSLETVDPEFAAGAAYAVRYVDALLHRGDTLRAVAKSARSVVEHPDDPRLYVQYFRLIADERTVALARGLERFPRLAELRVLAAQEARAAGDRAAERVALREALASDATLAQSQLRLAELWFQDGRPDSALRVLQRAPREGIAGAASLRRYAMARGVELLRSASDTVPSSYALPLALLALADSVESGPDTRGLLVAGGLQMARSELVLSSVTRACDGVRRADLALGATAALLARGVGDGSAADELRQAQAVMRGAVDDALRRDCAPAPPVGAGTDRTVLAPSLRAVGARPAPPSSPPPSRTRCTASLCAGTSLASRSSWPGSPPPPPARRCSCPPRRASASPRARRPSGRSRRSRASSC